MGTFKGKRIIPKHDGVWNQKKEYEELTKAIRERDVERAKQLSFQHIENQRMAIMRSIEAEDAERERAEKEKSRGHR